MSNKTKTAIVPKGAFDAGMVPEGFLPHATLAKHGSAYAVHSVNVLDTDSTLIALRKVRVMVAAAVQQLDTEAKAHDHCGIAGMRELARKSLNACDGLLNRVDQKQKGELFETQLGAATGALTMAAHTLAAASALLQACTALKGLPAKGFSAAIVKK